MHRIHLPPKNDIQYVSGFFSIVLQRDSVCVDSLYYCKYLPITKIFLDNYLSADLTKGSFGHICSFCVIEISKTSKIARFCMFLQ